MTRSWTSSGSESTRSASGLLDGDPAKDAILDMIDTQIREGADRFLADDYGTSSFAEWTGQRLGVELNRPSLQGT